MPYLWTVGLEPPKLKKLTSDVQTQVLVIGGGAAGLLCARELSQRGLDCVVLEAGAVGQGVTRGTTAVISAQHDTLYQSLIASFGRERAQSYLDANLDAVSEFRRLAGELSFDFEERASTMYTQNNLELLRNEVEAVKSLGFPAEFTASLPLPVDLMGAVVFPGMAQMNPVKLLYALCDGLEIYEQSRVLKLEGMTALTAEGSVSAKKIVVATHFPIFNKRGLYFVKLSQTRSYVLALENAPDWAGTYVSADDDGMYFRNYQDLLLVGGGDHRTGKPGGGFDSVRQFVQRNLPGTRERYAWATQDCMSLDGVPYIGQYSPAMPNVYVATGFNEWGMTSSMLSSKILADAITGRENRHAAAFAPARGLFSKAILENLGVVATSFLTPTAPRCPHMGCALKWNKAERSWDCACHGSRFGPEGAILENPSVKELKRP